MIERKQEKKIFQGMLLIDITILAGGFLQSFLFNYEVDKAFKNACIDVDQTIGEMNDLVKDWNKMNKNM